MILVLSWFMSEPSAKARGNGTLRGGRGTRTCPPGDGDRAELSHVVDLASHLPEPRLHKKGPVPPMQIKIIAFLILLANAGAAVQAHPAPSATISGTTAASVELEKQKAHAAAIANCEAMWDRTTHMTKMEWSRTCRRVQNRLRQLELR